MIFAPYSHEQIRQILEHRLGELALPIFDPQLVEYLAKRIARAAGDLRAALKICQRCIHFSIIYRCIRIIAIIMILIDRTIQIFLEKETRNRITHSKGVSSSKSSSDTGEHGRISKEYVLAAINEYNQDPFKVFIRGACQLDKALIVCACQEMKALGQYELTFAVLWDRLKSFLAGVCLQKQVSGAHRIDNDPFVESIEDITLLLPPYELFEIAVHRLIHVGIFQQQHSRYSLVIPRSMIFSLHREIEPSVITAALKDTAFEKFI